MTDAEISRRLALAIGYREFDVTIYERNSFAMVNRPYTIGMFDDQVVNPWCRFDYREPETIWPIAQKYNAFPCKCSPGEWRLIVGRRRIRADTAAKAVALAVIAGAAK